MLWEILKYTTDLRFLVVVITTSFAILVSIVVHGFRIIYVSSSTDEKLANSIKAKLSDSAW